MALFGFIIAILPTISNIIHDGETSMLTCELSSMPLRPPLWDFWFAFSPPVKLPPMTHPHRPTGHVRLLPLPAQSEGMLGAGFC